MACKTVFGLSGEEIILVTNVDSKKVHCGSRLRLGVRRGWPSEDDRRMTICGVPFREKAWWEEEPGSGKIWSGYEFHLGPSEGVTCKICSGKISAYRDGRLKSKTALRIIDGALEHNRILPAWDIKPLGCLTGYEHDFNPETARCRGCEITREISELITTEGSGS